MKASSKFEPSGADLVGSSSAKARSWRKLSVRHLRRSTKKVFIILHRSVHYAPESTDDFKLMFSVFEAQSAFS